MHKIHAGSLLKTTFSEDYTIWGYKDSKNSYADVGFPQDLRNCTKCHDNTKAPQADNWKNVPSRAACGSCHAGINFATGKGTTLKRVCYSLPRWRRPGRRQQVRAVPRLRRPYRSTTRPRLRARSIRSFRTACNLRLQDQLALPSTQANSCMSTSRSSRTERRSS